MKKDKQNVPKKTCADCIHEWACQTWTHGTIHNMDAEHCAVRETVKESNAYFIGHMDGKREASVIHCKDCRHMTLEIGIRWCNVWDRPNGYGDDGFCNYGERKEEK